MPIDRLYIFNKVNFFLKKENAFFTSSEVQLIIGVDAFRRIAEDIDFPKSNYSSYLTSGQWEVIMPGDFLKVDQNSDVTFKDAGYTYKLKPKLQKEIGRDVILLATVATPSNYFYETETKIGIYPPSTSGVIVIPYVSVPTSLSSDTDTNQLTPNCYMAASYWTVSECMLRDNDQRFGVYEQKYQQEVLRLKKRFSEMYEQDYDIKPSNDYLQRRND